MAGKGKIFSLVCQCHKAKLLHYFFGSHSTPQTYFSCTYIESLPVDDGRVHFEDSGFDGSGRRQHRHADVDRVRALRSQDHDLLLVLVLFL